MRRIIDLEKQHDFLLIASRGFFWQVVGVALLALLIVSARSVVLTIFLGVLAAVALRAAVDWVERVFHVSPAWAYRLVLLGAAAAIAIVIYWAGPRVVAQAHDLAKTVPQALGRLQQNVNQYQWGQDLNRVLRDSAQSAQAASRIKDYASQVMAGATRAIAILAIAMFLAANPRMYCDGALKVFPERLRSRAASVSQDIAFTLKWWLIGQLIPMAVLGVVTMAGLWLLGIPLAFTLALLTAAMLFLPYLGSVIAYIPTVLVAFTQGPEKALWVTVLYVVVHFGEGYVLTPLVQRRAVKLPPALTLTSQLFLWEFGGVLGVMAATPLAAAGLVLVRRLYLKEQPSEGVDEQGRVNAHI